MLFWCQIALKSQVGLLQSDVGALAKEVAKALQQLSVSASRASQAVEVIRETEIARSRMQDATSTLKVCTAAQHAVLALHTRPMWGQQQRSADTCNPSGVQHAD